MYMYMHIYALRVNEHVFMKMEKCICKCVYINFHERSVASQKIGGGSIAQAVQWGRRQV